MKKNLGTIDRIIRLAFALVVALLYATDVVAGITAIILGVFAVIFAVTSFMSFCPIYFGLKLSTAPKPKDA